ncbi:DUF222 domain-containing protein [Propionibacteriaceae bacterium G57]|uniref:DUF222 domain-containing protein n=1 Tax=Aestuariimicrobium sp. G57 TaxID=3418485 RepID=UPI003DA73236
MGGPVFPEDVDAGAKRAILVDLRQAYAAQRRAEAESFRLLTEAASLYFVVPGGASESVLHGERLEAVGGDGVPLVAEFCVVEIAALMGMTTDQVQVGLRHALDVRYRFPATWQHVMGGGLRVWQAEELAAVTHRLPAELCAVIDGELSALVGTMPWQRLRKGLRARVLELDPDPARKGRNLARGRRRVDFDESDEGITGMSAVLDAADAVFLNAQLTRLAGILGEAGSTDTLTQRRATALGVLASPARALQLLQASVQDALPDDLDDLDLECPARGQRGHTCGTVTVDPDRLLPKAELVVHLTDATLASGEGLARCTASGPERLDPGPVLAGWVKDLLGHARVTVRPVLDPGGVAPVDSYEVPAAMRRSVLLCNPYEVFPFAKRASAGLDLDHTRPWASSRQAWVDQLGDPVGERQPEDDPPSRIGNLAPLSRRVHRAKTHGGWTLAQPSPGIFLWKSPLGFGYLVTPSHSWLIMDPTGQILPRQQPATVAA